MSAYVFVSKPEQRPERVGSGTALWWSCSKAIRRTDRIFVYVAGRGLAYEWRATSDARPHEKWNYVCDVELVAKIEPPVAIAALRAAIPQNTWSPPHLNFRGYRSLSVTPRVEASIQALRSSAHHGESDFGKAHQKSRTTQSRQGQVFTVAKFHYVNGVVYFTARAGSTDIATLAQYSAQTTKSGDVKHPKVRVRTLTRLAEGVGLVRRIGKSGVQITDLGKKYYKARGKRKWGLSEQQKELLRTRILSNPSATPTIYSITSLLDLVPALRSPMPAKSQVDERAARDYPAIDE